jgi:hypothetical protein
VKIPTIKFNIGKHAHKVERMITDNSPAILTALGVVGVVSTAVLTHRAATQAGAVLEDARVVRNAKRIGTEDYNEPFTRAEKFSLTWKLYILPIASGSLAVGCIVGANRISAKRAAAIAGVLAMTQENFKEYKDKVEEKLTGPKKKEVREELAQERADKVFQATDLNAINLMDGDVLCVEKFTGRVFSCSQNRIERAVNDINKRIIDHDAACLSEFYDMVGLEHTGASDEFGWNVNSLMEVDFLPVFAPGGRRPAMLIDYVTEPAHRPWESGSFRTGR